jgi:hypothetical protein
MSKEVECNGDKYWITVESGIHPTTNKAVFTAFIKGEKPGIILGASVKNPDGTTMLFGDRLTALTNAIVVLESEVGGKATILN